MPMDGHPQFLGAMRKVVAGITGSPVATTLERISYDVSAGFLFR